MSLGARVRCHLFGLCIVVVTASACARAAGRATEITSTDGGPGETAHDGIPNVVFVTSARHVPGAFGGLPGADAICQAAAANARVPLPGRFVAWLSDTTHPAPSRLTSEDGDTARGWVRTDGLPFADTVQDLVTPKLWYPVVLDENGGSIRLPDGDSMGEKDLAITGTAADLVCPGLTCSDWTSTEGHGAVSYPATTSFLMWSGRECWQSSSCSEPLHLYCFQVDHVTQVAPKPAPSNARIAFISKRVPSTFTGIGAMDAICQEEAEWAGYRGGRIFRAFLARVGIPAADPSRFDFDGPPWFRPDGVQLVRQASDLLKDGADFLAPVFQYADGRNPDHHANTEFLKGSPYPGSYPPATCEDWTSNSNDAQAQIGLADFTSALRVSFPLPCDQLGLITSILCLEK